ncbi:MAG: hypothetical protein WAW39_10915 [Prosthecobacter sp.]|uniref:hypothetical protein n=1 Tax=Prosthecobacter sp. TaxID=1965333 RepID=UPI003BAF3765
MSELTASHAAFQPLATTSQVEPSGLEKARATFQHAGLTLPHIPQELACRLEQQDRWIFSTRDDTMSPGELTMYVNESYDPPPPYVMLAYSRHWADAMVYYLVFGPLRLFLYLSWGEGVLDATEEKAEIQKCFALADEILTAAMTSGKLFPDEYLTVLGSNLHPSHWGLSTHGHIRRSKLINSRRPSVLLTKILRWLNDPKPRRGRPTVARKAG